MLCVSVLVCLCMWDVLALCVVSTHEPRCRLPNKKDVKEWAKTEGDHLKCLVANIRKLKRKSGNGSRLAYKHFTGLCSKQCYYTRLYDFDDVTQTGYAL